MQHLFNRSCMPDYPCTEYSNERRQKKHLFILNGEMLFLCRGRAIRQVLLIARLHNCLCHRWVVCVTFFFATVERCAIRFVECCTCCKTLYQIGVSDIRTTECNSICQTAID